MKKLLSTLGVISSTVLFTTASFADVSASATAKWDATAKKDTTSTLVVTPMKSLAFQYAEGVNTFNSQAGAFDVTIQGQSGATDFELTSKVILNTLTRSDDASTLGVGVVWNGQKLSKDSPVILIDTAQNVNAGLEALSVSSAYAGTERSSAQGNFTFSIDNATSNGTTAASFQDLVDGVWDGDVTLQFNATWTTP